MTRLLSLPFSCAASGVRGLLLSGALFLPLLLIPAPAFAQAFVITSVEPDAQANRLIPADLAALLIADANRIRAVLGCS